MGVSYTETMAIAQPKARQNGWNGYNSQRKENEYEGITSSVERIPHNRIVHDGSDCVWSDQLDILAGLEHCLSFGHLH